MTLSDLLKPGRAPSMAGSGGGLCLVGDIGGTNARFAVTDLSSDRPQILHARNFLCADYPQAYDAIAAYLAGVNLPAPPTSAIIAVAGPVKSGAITLTNVSWSLSEAELNGYGFRTARLINDYAALAWGAPMLGEEEAISVGGAKIGDPDGAVAVLGPGTGFGAAALARSEGLEIPLPSEGGHMAFAPDDEVEIEVLRFLQQRFGRVSVERILAGPGICNLHAALEAIDGRTYDGLDPVAITSDAVAGEPSAVRTLDRFCAILGCVAGDLALAYGATGGVYIAGGIPPQIMPFIERGGFRRRFEAKGRFESYMKAIPTRVIVKPHVALIGAARAMRQVSAKA
jgi:glucokinase